MDDSEDIPENFGLEENIPASRNENFNYKICKISVDLDMIRFQDKTGITVTHEVPYCVAVVIWLLEGCITQTIDDFEEFKEKYFTHKYRILLNY